MNVLPYGRTTKLSDLGVIELSPSRRLRASLHDEQANGGLALELRLQIASDSGWTSTPQSAGVDADALPDLLKLIQAAIGKVVQAS